MDIISLVVGLLVGFIVGAGCMTGLGLWASGRDRRDRLAAQAARNSADAQKPQAVRA